jgi:hypothetical protein
LEMIGALLRNDLLLPVRSDLDDPAACICSPERAIGFGQNAFWPLESLANVSERGLIDFKIQDRIRHPTTCTDLLDAASPGTKPLIGIVIPSEAEEPAFFLMSPANLPAEVECPTLR